MFPSWIVTMAAYLCTFTEEYWFVHLKWGHFMTNKLYLNKAVG